MEHVFLLVVQRSDTGRFLSVHSGTDCSSAQHRVKTTRQCKHTVQQDATVSVRGSLQWKIPESKTLISNPVVVNSAEAFCPFLPEQERSWHVDTVAQGKQWERCIRCLISRCLYLYDIYYVCQIFTNCIWFFSNLEWGLMHEWEAIEINPLYLDCVHSTHFIYVLIV